MKEVTMTVRVKVPDSMSASDARREVRTMLKEQCWHSLEDGEIKILAVETERKKLVFWGGY